MLFTGMAAFQKAMEIGKTSTLQKGGETGHHVAEFVNIACSTCYMY
jgi:hypothetical protein